MGVCFVLYWLRMIDFFRPTKAKILLTLLLPLYVGYVVEVTASDTVVRSWSFSPFPFAALIFGAIAVWVNSENFFSGLGQFSFFQLVWYFFLEIVLPLALDYVIACALVYLYRRVRARYAKPEPPKAPTDALQL